VSNVLKLYKNITADSETYRNDIKNHENLEYTRKRKSQVKRYYALDCNGLA